MSQTTKKMMSLELEFIDPTAHGFVSWVDVETGQVLSTLGLGSTAKDIDYDDEGNQIGVDNGGAKYLEWSLDGVDYIKVIGGGIQFDEERSLEIVSSRDIYEFGEFVRTEDYVNSRIHLNNPDYTVYEKANVLHELDPDAPEDSDVNDRYFELEEIKTNYEGKTNAMILEHENAIVFTNPITNRMMGEIDMINEAFVWYGAFSLGAVVDDSYFEIKRTDSNKYNFTINADTDLNPEIGFKYEDVILWSIKVENNNFSIKNVEGYGLDVKNDVDEVEFTGEIIYKDNTLDDRFYTQTLLDEGVLDSRYYTETELDEGILDVRYYTETELDEGALDELYYRKFDVDAFVDALNIELENLTSKIDLLEERIILLEAASGNLEIYYRFNTDTNTWVKFSPIHVDEHYDLPDEAEEESIWFAELEDSLYRYRNLTFELVLPTTQTIEDDLPEYIEEGDLCYTTGSYGSETYWRWDGDAWQQAADINSLDDVYTTTPHKSDIDLELAEAGDIFKISSTDKFYKVVLGELEEIEDPIPLVSYKPDQIDFDEIIKVTS